MNLIEKLGLGKCKAIVDGAPEWATIYCTTCAIYGATFHWYGSCKNCYELPVLRTAIDDHERIDYVSDIRNHISPNTLVKDR